MKYLVALLLVVVVIGLIGVVTYVQIQGTIKEDATTNLESTAELRADSVTEWSASLRAQTELVANRDRFPTGGTTPEIVAYLEAAAANGSADIRSIHYVDVESETVLASTEEAYVGRELGAVGQPWKAPIDELRSSSDTNVATSNRSYRIGEEQAIAFASGVTGSKYLVVVSQFDEQRGPNSNGISTYLLNENGHSVTSEDDQRIAQLTDTRAFRSAVSDGSTTTIETGDEVRTYTPIEGTEWVAISTAEVGSLYSVSDTVGRNVIVLIVAALISLGAVGIVLGRSTVVPLAELKRRTREIEEGSLDVNLESTREDEIGRLYRAFESMRGALHEQVEQAQQARQDAERSRQEMERQNRRLDEFASTLSHDLRNPLAVARGHVELLATKLDASQSDLREHLGKIDDAHDRIDSIINDVLTLTRKGESVEEVERIDLEAVANEAWGNIDSKNATLHVADSMPIEGDRTRLLRAFENLFRNAIDHVGPDVTVTVGLTEDGFYVEDDGPGIPDEEMDSIFEYGHTTSDEGTGLGLSIVKTIAEAHGWSLWIDGTSGRGARFVFSDVFESEERIFEQSAFTWDHDRRNE